MEWSEIKDAIRADLLTRGLKVPRLRLSALESLERLLGEAWPDFPTNPAILLDLGKEEVSEKLAAHKENGTLNGAEKSVLNQIFRSIGVSNLITP